MPAHHIPDQTPQNAHGFELTPLDKTFGVVVTNIELRTLDAEQFQDLYRAWLDYALLIIPAQNLTPSEQEVFAQRFGPLIAGLEAVEISNVLPDGTLRTAPDDDMMKIIRGNMHWHQDNTYMPVQAKGAVFSAHVIPNRGGDTAFADMRDAYDALDTQTKAQIETLSAHHSLVRSQRKLGEETKTKDSEYIGYGLDVADIPLRPLVKTHPETGRKTLALGRHAFDVTGMDRDASGQFLEDLISFATQDENRVYQHQWQPGDVVIWDNRCLMHRACDWDYAEPRIMVHSRIAGDAATETARNLSAT